MTAWDDMQTWLMMNVGSKEAEAALVIASRIIDEETEACAGVADEWVHVDAAASDIAKAIRRRKET